MHEDKLSPGKQDAVATYRKRARRYNTSTFLLYNVLGLRVGHHRRMAVRRLGLRRGDTAVEIGCGTGANFPFLEEIVGSEGRIVGVDLSEDMLQEARKRVRNRGWSNVRLERRDAASFDYPDPTNGILSTFALTMVPEYDEVIAKGAFALAPEGRFVVMDFKMPTGAMAAIAPRLAFLITPYGGSVEMATRHPWEALERHLVPASFHEFWFGMAYIASARRPEARNPSGGVI